MAYSNRPTNSGLRASSSLGGPQASSNQSPMLLARVNEKKEELENLKQLRDLSAGLAAQMQALEAKLSTLSDGTEAVAAVLSNWNTVLQAINMASSMFLFLQWYQYSTHGSAITGHIPKPKSVESGDATEIISETTLPQTLVRIPVEQEQPQSQPQGPSDKES
ncbi:MAG: hypothetical protein Q9222_000425 [Ikaeria aurantiellina]